MGKYDPLAVYLAKSDARRISLTFKEIEALLGGPLPASAYMHAAWWSNTGGSHIQAQAWLAQGFRTEQVDLAGETLVFERDKMVKPTEVGGSAEPPAGRGSIKRHPAVGAMKGMVTIMPGTDLTAPVDPQWVERLYREDPSAVDPVGGLRDPRPDRG